MRNTREPGENPWSNNKLNPHVTQESNSSHGSANKSFICLSIGGTRTFVTFNWCSCFYWYSKAQMFLTYSLVSLFFSRKRVEPHPWRTRCTKTHTSRKTSPNTEHRNTSKTTTSEKKTFTVLS